MKLIDNRQKQTQQLKAGKSHLLSFRDKSRREVQAPPTPKAQHGDETIAAKDVVSYPSSLPHPKIGRNDPCFCGSGKKYKKCCLAKEEQEPSKETSA